MTLLAEDLAWLRTYVTWDPPTDTDLSDRFDVLGSRERVAEWFVRARLTEMIDNPGSFSIGGEYSENWAANIKALTDALGEVRSIPAGGSAGDLTVSRLVRDGGSDFR